MQLEIHELDRRYAALRIEDPTRRAQLAASIARHGQQGPVLVVRHDDHYVLVDGYVRVAALLELGRDLVEAVVLDDVDEAGALILRHRLSTRRTTALEDGWLLCELIETYQR
jgi:ParB-like chromosome segregation protein Spo0J